MNPQTRDVAPAGGDTVYTTLHNFSAERMYIFLRAGMSRTIGNSVGFFVSGIALAFGIASILLLSSKGRFKLLSRQDTLLCIYTVTLLFFVVAFQIQELVQTISPAIDFFQSFDEMEEYRTKLVTLNNATIGIMVGLADGLLVWRCFMTQRVLGGRLSKWGNIFWTFPACLWITTVGMAFTVSAINVDPWHTRASTSGYTTNIVLNIYATLFISTRLLLHRRMIMTRLGSTVSTAQHIRIIGILLESAAINLPVTVTCAVGAGVGIGSILEATMLPIAVGSQALASVLIIHQAAMGKVLNRRGQSEIEGSAEMREHNSCESPEPAV